jgi:hypothetical protein
LDYLKKESLGELLAKCAADYGFFIRAITKSTANESDEASDGEMTTMMTTAKFRNMTHIMKFWTTNVWQ